MAGTCSGISRYPTIAKALAGLPTKSAYLDGELSGVRLDGRTAFKLIQNALEHGDASLVYFVSTSSIWMVRTSPACR